MKKPSEKDNWTKGPKGWLSVGHTNEKMECVYYPCKGIAHKKTDESELTIEGRTVKTETYYYKCDTCGKEFSTEELDTVAYENFRRKFFNSGVNN